jgi:predicted amidohydrolase YtcJ
VAFHAAAAHDAGVKLGHVLFAACLFCAHLGARADTADLVLLNGNVLTVDAGNSVAQALAIAQGRIVAVGSDEQMRAFIGPDTRVLDLAGKTATPGLIDTHFHMDGTAPLEVDAAYPSVKSIAEIVEKVRARAASLAPGEWIQGRGWDEGKLEERRYILASDLDAAAPKNPVILAHATGHYAVANSAALALAGITKDSRDPPAGTIDKDASGAPTGVLKESATALVFRLIPPYAVAQQRAGIVKVLQALNAEGMTAVKDPGVPTDKWDIYRDLLEANELTARVFVLWEGKGDPAAARALIERVSGHTRPYDPAHNDGRLIAGGVKLFLDGSGGARTAWLQQEWSRNYREKDPGNFGYPLIEPYAYREIVRLFHEAGMHIGTHAIGDRAIDWAVDTYAEVLRKKPVRGLRHAIIHANIPTVHAIEVMASLQRLYDAGYPEVQAPFMWWIGDNYAANFGERRAKRLLPLKSYLDRHVIWAGGSDYDVTPLPARYGIWASMARETLKGAHGAHPFGTTEAVDVRSALRSYTIWAAHQLFLDDRVGSLEVGKQADIAVWDRDLYSVPASSVRDMKCEMTLLAGQVVYRAPGTSLGLRAP